MPTLVNTTVIKVSHSQITVETLSQEDGLKTVFAMMPQLDTELSHLMMYGMSLEEDGLLILKLITTINTQSVKESFSTKLPKCTNSWKYLMISKSQMTTVTPP